jgi:hypothetical protein
MRLVGERRLMGGPGEVGTAHDGLDGAAHAQPAAIAPEGDAHGRAEEVLHPRRGQGRRHGQPSRAHPGLRPGPQVDEDVRDPGIDRSIDPPCREAGQVGDGRAGPIAGVAVLEQRTQGADLPAHAHEGGADRLGRTHQAGQGPGSGIGLAIEDADGRTGAIQLMRHPGRDEGRAAGDPRPRREADAEGLIEPREVDRGPVLVAGMVGQRPRVERMRALDMPERGGRGAGRRSTFVQAERPPAAIDRWRPVPHPS